MYLHRSSVRRSNLERDSLALLSCLLFICIEFQQDSISSGLALMKKGFMLSSVLIEQKSTLQADPAIRGLVMPYFLRYTVFAASLGRMPPKALVEHITISLLQIPRTIIFHHFPRFTPVFSVLAHVGMLRLFDAGRLAD